MKYILKKYWIHITFILIIYIPILVLTLTRTNYYLILKGDTAKFESIVEVDTNYEVKGSFSTISVISFNKSTIFQNMIVDKIPTVEKGKVSKYETHLSDLDMIESGRIDYYSSIEIAIIKAYTEAKKIKSDINIEYEPDSFMVDYYVKNSRFKIGDKIIGCNDYDLSDMDSLRNCLQSLKVGDTIKLIRNNKNMEITLEKGDPLFDYVERYNINYKTIYPSIKIKNQIVGGPSGGLLQTLSIYNRLIEKDLTYGLKIAGTGTINSDGTIGRIGGIREKIPTALDDHIDIFFCPKGNFEAAKEAYDSLNGRSKMKLVEVETIYDAIKYLEEYENEI